MAAQTTEDETGVTNRSAESEDHSEPADKLPQLEKGDQILINDRETRSQ